MNWKSKYLKYKTKYIRLKKSIGSEKSTHFFWISLWEQAFLIIVDLTNYI